MNLDHLRRQLQQKAARVAEQVAREAEHMLKASAPVDSGHLRNQITAQLQAHLSGAEITIESGAEYAQYNREHREAWDRLMRELPTMIKRAWHRIQ